jgi:hypothetical protein
VRHRDPLSDLQLFGGGPVTRRYSQCGRACDEACMQAQARRSPANSRDREKRRGRPRTGIGPVVSLRLYPGMEAAVAAWIDRQPDPKSSRSEAIRRLIERG